MPADSFYCLENVDFTVLDHLLDAGVGSAVYAGAGVPVTATRGIVLLGLCIRFWLRNSNEMRCFRQGKKGTLHPPNMVLRGPFLLPFFVAIEGK